MTPECQLSLEQEVIQRPGVEPVLHLVTPPAAHVGPALALPRDHVAVVVGGASYVAVAGFAAVPVLQGQPVVLGHALVTVASHHEALARAVARLLVAAVVRNDPLDVARTF